MHVSASHVLSGDMQRLQIECCLAEIISMTEVSAHQFIQLVDSQNS